MKRAIAAVIGHVDHGKTSLVRALTGTDTDRLDEEKRRGISIVLGFAFLPDGADADAGIDLVDVPGHERFVRAAVAGAGGLDFVLLVVAANEGVRPQTREHLAIAALLGVERFVLAISKSDLVDADGVVLATLEAREAAERAGLHCLGVVATGAGGTGIAQLRAMLLDARAQLPRPSRDGLAFLPVDRVFSVAGHGTVLTGTLRGGALAVGEMVSVLPGGAEARIRGLQTHGRSVDRVEPGGRVAVNLRGLPRDAVRPGAALAPPNTLGGSDWLGVWLRASGADLHTGARLRLLIGTDEQEVLLRLLDRDVLADGAWGPAQLKLGNAIAVPARERFVLRIASPPATVGGGLVIEPETRRSRRNDAATCARFALRATGTRDDILGDAVRRAGRAGIRVASLARLIGTGEAAAVAALPDGMAVRAGVAMSPDALAEVETGIRLALNRSPDGLSRDALARLLPAAGASVLDEALSRLAGRNTLERRDALFRLPDVVRDRARASRDAQELAAMATLLRDGGLAPPDLPADPRSRKLLEALERRGLAIRAPDRVQKRVIVFHAEAVARARGMLSTLLGDGARFSVGEAGELLGISRKFSVPLLEHLDATGFTTRDGDRRQVVVG